MAESYESEEKKLQKVIRWVQSCCLTKRGNHRKYLNANQCSQPYSSSFGYIDKTHSEILKVFFSEFFL